MLLICGALSGRRSSAIRSCAGDRHGHAGRWAAWLMVPIGARALSVARTRLPRRFLASDGHFGDTDRVRGCA